MKHLLLALSIAASLAFTASFASVPATQAYSKGFDLNNHKLDRPDALTVDKAGNAYLSAHSEAFGSFLCSIIRFDPYGNQIWNRSFSIIGGYFQFITSDDKGNIWAVAPSATNMTASGILIVKLDISGNIGWMQVHHPLTAVQSESPLAIVHDGSGNLNIALRAPVGSALGLEVLQYSPLGSENSSAEYTNPYINPQSACFSPDGYLIASGIDSTSLSASFEILSPQGSILKQEAVTPNPGFQYSYVVAADPANNFLVGTNITTSSGSGFTARYFQENSSLTWSSPLVEGNLMDFRATDPNHVYGSIQIPSGHVISKLGASGAEWSKPIDGDYFDVDGVRGVASEHDFGMAGNGSSLTEYDTTGGQLWTGVAVIDTLYQNNNTVFVQCAGGATYFAATANRTGGDYDMVFQKWVTGPTLKTVTTTAPTLVGGTTSSCTANLNWARTTDTVLSLLSSNPSLIGVPASTTVKKGLLSASFLSLTRPVDTISRVTLSARGLGVQRSVVITLLPASLSSLSLSVPTTTGGTTVTATLALSGPTGLVGRTVTLKSSNPALATVPPSVFFGPNANSITFPVKTISAANGDVTITASWGGVTVSKDLVVTP